LLTGGSLSSALPIKQT